MGDHGLPVLKDGTIQELSVSRIAQYDSTQVGGCPRKSYFIEMMGKETATTKSQLLGTQVHSQLEHYQITGQDVLGPIARAAKHLVPRFPGVRPEYRFGSGLDAGGIPLVGTIDIENRSAWTLNNEGEIEPQDPNTAEILDYKTTKSIDMYAKSGSELLQTVQMPGYAERALRADPTLENVRLSHVYIETGSKHRAKKTSLVVSRKAINSRWKEVDAVVRDMVKVFKSAKSVEEVPPNYDACEAFGGCSFKSVCPRSREAIMASLFGGKAMSILDRMRERSAGGSTTSNTTAPTAPVVPAPALPAVSPGVAAARASLEAAERAEREGVPTPPPVLAAPPALAPALPAPTLPSPVLAAPVIPTPEPVDKVIYARDADTRIYILPHGTDPTKTEYGKGICRTPGDNFSFVLLDGKVRQVPITTAITWVAKPPAQVVALYDALLAATPARAAVTPPDAPASQPALAATPISPLSTATIPDAPKKRGRPAGSTNAAATTPVTAAGHGLRMYINAIPVGLAYTDLSKFLDPLCKDLCDEFKAADIRCAPEDSPLGFGKWKGALAEYVRSQPPTGDYVAFTRESEIVQIAVEALVPLCDLVIRGV